MILWDRIIAGAGFEEDKKFYRIKWQDGRETVIKGLPKQMFCNKCGKLAEGLDIAEYLQYQGLCRPCFASAAFGVNGKMNSGDYIWKRPVNYTSPSPFSLEIDDEEPNGADLLGNNFGIGDIVLHRPENRRDRLSKTEAIITGIHEYWKDPLGQLRIYLTRVLFRGGSGSHLIPSKQLEALTCNGLELDIKKWIGKLDNVECAFDPSESKIPYIKEKKKNPIARAIWISYKLNHIFQGNDIEDLTVKSIDVTSEIRKNDIGEDRMHLWFKKKFNLSPPYSCKMGDTQIAALLPYLTGQKICEYQIVKKDEK